MYPTVKDLILAHPLPFFLFWLPAVLYLGIPINRDWYSLEPGVQLTAAFIFCLWAVSTVIALPKVWWHVYQKRKHTRAGIDPELLAQRRRTRQRWTLALLTVATFEYVLSWISGHSFAEDGHHYLTALVIAASLCLLPFVLFYRLTRTWRSYLFLALLSIAGGAGLWQLTEHPEFLTRYPELSLYLPLTAALGAFLPPLLIVVTLLLCGFARLRGFSLPQAPQAKDKPFAVTWCLPVPKRSASADSGMLPDYCRALLATGSRKPEVA